MPGLILPRRALRPQGFKANVLGRWLLGGATALTLVLSQSDCGFPRYEFMPTSNAGASTGGSAGSAGAAMAGGGNGGSGALGGSSGGAGNVGDAAGEGGAAGDAGTSGSAPCVYQNPAPLPDHCSDKFTGDDETGVDCGGPTCLPCETSQPCVRDSDCASGTCTAASTTCTQVLSLQYMSIVADAFTNGPKFRLVINYLDTKPTLLSALRIRYYFNHNGVTEPVIARDTQATLDSGGSVMDISTKMSALVYRLPPGLPAQNGNQVTDSYLELTFSSFFQMAAGATLDITADIIAGSADVPFQQASHYSFANVGTLTPTDAITVYRDQQRLWGAEPPLAPLPDCAYAAGVNLGGPSVTLGANAEGPVLSGADAGLTFTGTLYSSATPKPFPASDANTAKMLSTAFTFTDADTATWSVPKGKYLVYAWLTSAGSADSGVLSIQDTPLDKFYGLQRSSGSGWARVGPDAIEVTDGTLHMSATGKVNVAGLELFKPAP